MHPTLQETDKNETCLEESFWPRLLCDARESGVSHALVWQLPLSHSAVRVKTNDVRPSDIDA